MRAGVSECSKKVAGLSGCDKSCVPVQVAYQWKRMSANLLY